MTADEATAIRSALAKLDAQNENHWTEGGQPRLDALGLTPTPKRADVTEAAPLFSRSNLELPQSKAAPVAVVATEVVTGTGQDKLAKLQGDLDAAEAAVRDQQDQLNLAQKAVVKAQAERDMVLIMIAKAGGRADHANIHGIRAVLERSKQVREERAGIAQELRKHGITAKLLQPGSKLDQAMARKTGFGLQRPKMQQAQGN